MIDYLKRDQTLRDMGYGSYAEYLASPLWRQIRAKVLGRAKGKCHICKTAPPTQVHHRSYHAYVLSGMALGRLNAVCRPCHELGEFGDHGQKVNLRECNARLSRFLKPAPGFCVRCKKNSTRLGRALCRSCRRKEKSTL